jgi:hypothetical protein
VHIEITCSISYLDSISYIILDSTPPLSLPQIILVQTNTMKVALMPNPITVVTKLVPEPNISNYQNQPLTKKRNLTSQRIWETHVRKMETFWCQSEYIRKQKEPMNLRRKMRLKVVGGTETANNRYRWESSGEIRLFDFLSLLEHFGGVHCINWTHLDVNRESRFCVYSHTQK